MTQSAIASDNTLVPWCFLFRTSNTLCRPTLSNRPWPTIEATHLRRLKCDIRTPLCANRICPTDPHSHGATVPLCALNWRSVENGTRPGLTGDRRLASTIGTTFSPVMVFRKGRRTMWPTANPVCFCPMNPQRSRQRRRSCRMHLPTMALVPREMCGVHTGKVDLTFSSCF